MTSNTSINWTTYGMLHVTTQLNMGAAKQDKRNKKPAGRFG
jgi:hypothetical protein